MMRKFFFYSAIFCVLFILLIEPYWPPILWAFVIVVPYIIIGLRDAYSQSHNLLRNYPVTARLRYLFESIRPEIQQYFIHSNQSGRPFNREMRSIIYQRAKSVLDTLPLGTQQDINLSGYEYAEHSLNVKIVEEDKCRILVGQAQCAKPYNASRLNVSAMSFGSLSANAVMALNWGAQVGGFASNTGEGGLSEYHLRYEGDLIWQIGTGYFGCRTHEGNFDRDAFMAKARMPSVKMIEIKLSQGAKPSHGGILPAEKLTPEIAKIRGVKLGEDVLSPPIHSAFSNPSECLDFLADLRELSGGKPIGIKLCVGSRSEFLSLCKAMLSKQSWPDFISVDGAEGGTGAAPLEFSNHIGTPINEALIFVHNCLVGCNLRDNIKVFASGKVVDGFDMATKLALGADACNSARAMMFALGCVQSLRCHENTCPTGVATQDPSLEQALVVKNKFLRVAQYHENTIHAFREVVGAMGLDDPDKLAPHHIRMRLNELQSKHYGEIFEPLASGALLSDTIPSQFASDWQAASAEQW